MVRRLAVLVALVLPLAAQVPDYRNISYRGTVDASASKLTKPHRYVATLPGSCTSGETFTLMTTWQPYTCVFGVPAKLLTGAVAWSDLTGVPGTFTPSAHVHDVADLTGGPLAVARGGTGNATWIGNRCVQVSADGTRLEVAAETCGIVAWANLTGVPSTFPPQTHAHDAGDLTAGLVPLARGGTNNATWIGGRCVQVSADGTKLEVAADACGTGAGGPAPYVITFTGQTSLTVTAATHGLGAGVLDGGCYVEATNKEHVNYASWAKTSSGDVTVSFDAAFAGGCVLHGGAGAEGGGGAVSSVFGRTGDVTATANDYAFSQISGTAAVAQGGTGAATAMAGLLNLLPAVTGQDGKCLVVASGGTSVEWGTCATSGGGGDVTPLTAAFTTSSFPTVPVGGYACVNFSLPGMVSGDFAIPGLPSTLEPGLSAYIVPGSDGGAFCIKNADTVAKAPANGQQLRVLVLRPTV